MLSSTEGAGHRGRSPLLSADSAALLLSTVRRPARAWRKSPRGQPKKETRKLAGVSELELYPELRAEQVSPRMSLDDARAQLCPDARNHDLRGIDMPVTTRPPHLLDKLSTRYRKGVHFDEHVESLGFRLREVRCNGAINEDFTGFRTKLIGTKPVRPAGPKRTIGSVQRVAAFYLKTAHRNPPE